MQNFCISNKPRSLHFLCLPFLPSSTGREISVHDTVTLALTSTEKASTGSKSQSSLLSNGMVRSGKDSVCQVKEGHWFHMFIWLSHRSSQLPQFYTILFLRYRSGNELFLKAAMLIRWTLSSYYYLLLCGFHIKEAGMYFRIRKLCCICNSCSYLSLDCP